MLIDSSQIKDVKIPGMNDGTGKAVCNGQEEILNAGTCHICKKGSAHSIPNTGSEDLVLLTFVVE